MYVAAEDLDRDLTCPICTQMIKDAFLTACGHCFCYLCILKHLGNKKDCPTCGRHLTDNQIYPNLLLDKLLKKASASQVLTTQSSVGQSHRAAHQGREVSVKELDTIMALLMEKKMRIEQEEAERNLQKLQDFLYCLRQQKIDELNEIEVDLQYIEEDLSAVEQHKIELYRAKDNKYSSNSWSSSHNKNSVGTFQSKKTDGKCLMNSKLAQREDSLSIHAQVNDLQECYLQNRRQFSNQRNGQEEESYNGGLANFQSVFSAFSKNSRLRVIAELEHEEPFHSRNIISSIEFNRDDELFATASVSRRIKVFDFSSVVNEPAEAQFPVVEMSTMSKVSCLSWNKFTKNQIASSDYAGIVTVWDVNTRQSVMEYEEHEKRAWSVDFSCTEPFMLVSGSDDFMVKVWCTRQAESVINIDMKANICCVNYNPGSSYYIAVGSADHDIHYYDLRNISQPVHVFGGHKKAVSYVKFLSTNEFVSASTDSTLRLWDVTDSLPLRTFRGHKNVKNFVGLSVNGDYIACGSETNEVFVYHKEITKPLTCHQFSSPYLKDGEEDAGSQFVSAVCWKSDSSTLMTANSQGAIKVLSLDA